MMKLLEKLGQNPKASLALFLRGLGLFVIGVFFIGLGYFYHYFWQIVGLIFLAIGGAIAIWGYIGIFANRWFNILNKN